MSNNSKSTPTPSTEAVAILTSFADKLNGYTPAKAKNTFFRIVTLSIDRDGNTFLSDEDLALLFNLHSLMDRMEKWQMTVLKPEAEA